MESLYFMRETLQAYTLIMKHYKLLLLNPTVVSNILVIAGL